MSFTVKEVMDIEVMKHAKVRTAADTLSQHSVESVSVIEIPVENFIRKNELVLSTAIGCSDDPIVFKEFVQDIYESGSAALAIATGRHIIDIPAEVLRFAEDHNFPILEIPWEVRFADITQAVLSELYNWHQINLKRSEDLQKHLLNLFLSGAHLSDAADTISQGLGSPVLIINKDGEIKGKSKHANSIVENLNLYLLTAFQSIDLVKDAKPLHFAEDSIIKLKIQSANKLHGYLLFKLSPEHSTESPFSDGKRHVLEHVLSAITLWFQRENAIQETEMRLRDDFVWSLAKGEIDSWDTVLSRAKSLDYNLTLPYVCIIGLMENMETLYRDRELEETSYEHWLYSMIHDIEEQIIQAGRSFKRESMTTYQQDRFIIFLEVPVNQVDENAKKFLDLIENRLGKLLPGIILSWGIGENHVGIKTFHESYNDARMALDIGCRQKEPGHRSTYANTGIYRALFTVANNPEMKEITLSTITALIEYDKQRGLDLMNTLNIYIRNQGNVSQTSRSLNLHRQSLLYRLKKIESLTDRSLVDTDDLFLLDLSLRLWTTGLISIKK